MRHALLAAMLVLSAAPVLAQTTEISWAASATPLRGRNGEQFTFRCPGGGSTAAVWGTDVYSDDSSICTAAMHAVPGLNFISGFDVVIEIRPGAASYRGSTRHGVTTGNWNAFAGSFIVRAASAAAKRQQTVTWGTNAAAMREQRGARVTIICPADGSAAPVWGTDIYSDDSSICSAAVHAGRIDFGGGTVTIEMTGAQPSFQASTRHRITSNAWGEWPGSFRFVDE